MRFVEGFSSFDVTSSELKLSLLLSRLVVESKRRGTFLAETSISRQDPKKLQALDGLRIGGRGEEGGGGGGQWVAKEQGTAADVLGHSPVTLQRPVTALVRLWRPIVSTVKRPADACRAQVVLLRKGLKRCAM